MPKETIAKDWPPPLLHNPVIMKKSYFFLSVFFTWVSIPAFCQRSCDTLICKDGRIILAEIIGQKDGKIDYYHCNDRLKSPYTIEKEAVKSIGFQKAIPVKVVEDLDDPSKTRYILWAGIRLADLWFQSGPEKLSWFQIGGQVNLANENIQAGLIFRPLLFESRGYNAFKKNWPNSEITMFIKKVSVGRLTGETSKAYWGCDFQYGRQSYTYEEFFNNKLDKVKVSTTSYAILPRIGLQFGFQHVMFDLTLPIGYSFIKNVEQRTFNPFDYSEGRITIQPSASLGLRF